MGFFDRFTGKCKAAEPPSGGAGRGVDELARRMGIDAQLLGSIRPAYREFTRPKRSGGARKILAPEPSLKNIQRLILRRVLGRLESHPAATGFERGRSIVDNARPHLGRAAVVKMDLRDFFPATSAKRVEAYFRAIGWGKAAAELLTRICCHQGGLPQGAPTSPRLSNLVNRKLDARLAAFAARFKAAYTRYADDMTISFAKDDRKAIRNAIGFVRRIAQEEGYKLHERKKLSVRRRHQRQTVTGLVVNEKLGLPRRVRRRLRAVEHHLATGKEATLDVSQLAGWNALRKMIERPPNP